MEECRVLGDVLTQARAQDFGKGGLINRQIRAGGGGGGGGPLAACDRLNTNGYITFNTS